MPSPRELGKEEVELLIDNALKARKNSYAPYSKFHVGAALLSTSGTWYLGCNVENASYGGSICAERTAVLKAVSEGDRSFVAIGVSTDVEALVSPCGMCRQFMVEFGKELPVYLIAPSRKYRVTKLNELLPDSFGPSDLDRERV